MTNPSKAYDPVLKVAADEIRAILKKHDIGGAMTLATDTHAELVVEFPSWSPIQMHERAIQAKMTPGSKVNGRAVLYLMSMRDGLALHAETLNGAVTKIMEAVPELQAETKSRPLPGLPGNLSRPKAKGRDAEPLIVVPKMRGGGGRRP